MHCLDMSDPENFEAFLKTIRTSEQSLTRFQEVYKVTFDSEDYLQKLQSALSVTALKGKDFVEELHQVLFFTELERRFQAGDDFTAYAYIAYRFYLHLDYQHGMKNEVAKTRYQTLDDADVSPLIDLANTKLLNLQQMLMAAETDVELSHILSVLHKAADSQNVVTCMELFYNLRLERALLTLGFKRTACMLRLMGDAHQAMDMPGLSMVTRCSRLERIRRVYVTMLGEVRLYSHTGEQPLCTLYRFMFGIDKIMSHGVYRAWAVPLIMTVSGERNKLGTMAQTKKPTCHLCFVS